MNNNEKRLRIQLLKNHEVFSKINDKIAKGVSNIKILSITYLKEYVKTKFNKETESEAFNIPSKEKISEEMSNNFELFISTINWAKQMFL